MSWAPSRRRQVAGGVVAVALLVVLAARLGGDDAGGDPPPTSTPGTSTSMTGEVKLPRPAGAVEGDLPGARVRLEVQPLVRAGSLTVLTAVLTVLEPPEGGALTIGDTFGFRGAASAYHLSDVRLFAPEPGVLASPAAGADGKPAPRPPATNRG